MFRRKMNGEITLRMYIYMFAIFCLCIKTTYSDLVDSSSHANDVISRWKRAARPVTCLDRFAAIPDHTMCLASLRGASVNSTERSTIVSEHNIVRGNVNPPAADMMEMQYFIGLEKEAQIWAEQCKMDHDGAYQRYQPGRFHVGQNIAVSGAPMTWTEVIDLWKNEEKSFNYSGSGNSLLDVGHYTQLVWSSTVLVGCGVSKCDNKYFYVCNYAPSGNRGPLNMPYLRSASGSSCDSCAGNCNTTARLCDCSGKFCLNGGILNLTTCECHCNAAVKHYETDICELVCEDEPDNSLCGTPPFDKSSCGTNMATVTNCPAMCNICPYAGANYTEGSVPLPSKSKAPFTKAPLMMTILTGLSISLVSTVKYF